MTHALNIWLITNIISTLLTVCKMRINTLKNTLAPLIAVGKVNLFCFYIKKGHTMLLWEPNCINTISIIYKVSFERLWSDQRAPCRLTQHSLSQSSQVHVGRLEGFFPLLVQGQLLTFNQDGGAAFQDPFRRPLHHQQVAEVQRVLQLMYWQLDTTRGRQWDSELREK